MILLWFFAKIAKNGSARLNKMAARAKNKKKIFKQHLRSQWPDLKKISEILGLLALYQNC